jgi:hypothetical protein
MDELERAADDLEKATSELVRRAEELAKRSEELNRQLLRLAEALTKPNLSSVFEAATDAPKPAGDTRSRGASEGTGILAEVKEFLDSTEGQAHSFDNDSRD